MTESSSKLSLILGLIASVLTILSFVTGVFSLPELVPSEKPFTLGSSVEQSVEGRVGSERTDLESSTPIVARLGELGRLGLFGVKLVLLSAIPGLPCGGFQWLMERHGFGSASPGADAVAMLIFVVFLIPTVALLFPSFYLSTLFWELVKAL